MNIAILTTVFLMSVNAFAACPKQAKEAFSSYKKSSVINAQSKKTFEAALFHYESFSDASDFYIDSVETYIKGNRVSGFVVDVTDGGDESTISYIFNAKKKLVVAYWHNQSPMTYWFCGKENVQDSEETIDVPRI